jgi:tRNA (guanine-N7-)-methyltransferase
MGHKKLIRFEAIKNFPNVLERPEGMQGEWKNHFGNTNDITLELACGKGEYAVGLGRMHANRNLIGVDIKGNRIWRGAITALDEGLNNVAFLRTEIDKLTNYFSANEVSGIWITFPDPQLRKAKKRLTHPKFLRLYRQFLKPTAIIHLKTDSPDLYQFTKTVINLFDLTLLEDFDDAYHQDGISEELKIKTYYESLGIAKSNRVHYLKFRLDKPLPIEKEEELKLLIDGNSTN